MKAIPKEYVNREEIEDDYNPISTLDFNREHVIPTKRTESEAQLSHRKLKKVVEKEQKTENRGRYLAK